MVIGGYYGGGDGAGYLSDVELLSLDPDNPVPPCLMNLSDFPVALFGASGSVGDGNKANSNLVIREPLTSFQMNYPWSVVEIPLQMIRRKNVTSTLPSVIPGRYLDQCLMSRCIVHMHTWRILAS